MILVLLNMRWCKEFKVVVCGGEYLNVHIGKFEIWSFKQVLLSQNSIFSYKMIWEHYRNNNRPYGGLSQGYPFTYQIFSFINLC